MKETTTEGTKKKETPRDILARFMAEQDMRKTPERFAVLDVVVRMKGHHSADEILTMMPQDFPVSRGTIYSTLALLVECGLAYNHQTEGATLYECAFNKLPHHHYICTGCHKIWDLQDSTIEQTVSKLKTPRFKKLRCHTHIYDHFTICQAKLGRVKKKIEKQKGINMTREEKRCARINEELGKGAEWFKEN